MKKINKILSIILAILMVISIIPITASAETPTSGTIGGVTWEFDNASGTLTFSGEGGIPSFNYSNHGGVEERPWNSFFYRYTKHIVIGDGIKYIGDYAFAEGSIIETVTIGKNVEYIGYNAFNYCDNITYVYYNGTQEEWNSIEIDSYNDDLTSAKLYTSDYKVYSDSGTYGDNIIWVFDASTGTLTVSGTGVMPDDWNISEILSPVDKYEGTSRPWELYKYDIKKVVVSEGITTIGASAFRYFPNLTEVYIASSVTKIIARAFRTSNAITDVYYSGTEEQWNNIVIGGSNEPLLNANIHYNYAECEHKYETTVTAPTCTEQGYTTYTCECGDTYVDDYVDALGHTDNDNDGFCDICKEIAYPDAQLCGENIIWAFDESTGTLTLTGTGAMYDYESVSTSGFFINQPWYSFADKITKIVINDGVTYIGEYAFCKCENLTSITMSGSVTEIGCYAFAFCTGLTSLTIPYGVTTIDVGAFGGLLYLTTVTIPCSVKTIANEAFILSYGIKDVYYSGCEEQWNEIFIGTSNFPDATIHFLGEETHECSYNAVVTPPTCTEQGYITYTCGCGDSYVADYVNETGHSYTSEITTLATHTATGIMTYTCSCGDTYTETIEKTEKHNYESVVTAPTCTEQGYTTYTCECDDSFVGDYVDATGHADNDGDGYCDACNEQLEDNNDSQISIISVIMRIINFLLELLGIK